MIDGWMDGRTDRQTEIDRTENLYVQLEIEK